METVALVPEVQQDARDARRKGIAPVKAEYRLDATPVTNDARNAIATASSAAVPDDDANEDSSKRSRTSKDDKKDRSGGQNKGRRFAKIADQGVQLCKGFANGKCTFVDAKTGLSNCKFTHDFREYFAIKPTDLAVPPSSAFSHDAPYISAPYYSPFSSELTSTATDAPKELEDPKPAGSLAASITHVGTEGYCPVFRDLGHCPSGWKCRFLSGHIEKADEADNGKTVIDGYKIKGSLMEETLTDEERMAIERRDELNWVDKKSMSKIRSGKYEYHASFAYLQEIEPEKEFNIFADTRKGRQAPKQPQKRKFAVPLTEEEEMQTMNAEPVEVKEEKEMGDVDLARTRPEEKRRLNWENGLYLAPLTTVGNLPFRRLCVDYGATITCSEMALATPLVSGQSDDWALTRRHKSEKMFGVQIAGGYANRVVPAAEVLKREIGQGIDFVDVNLGCPIDLIFNQGAGSALMDATGRLGKILLGMNKVLGDIPYTVKFRTGVADKKNTAHKLIPRLINEWGVSGMTLHGRSRQQRYSKLADWAYIKECADELRSTLEEANLPPVPIFGNGDCFSAQSYYEEKEASGVDGVMVARGALIKPWLFTEIAERREWDISAVERLEGIRKYAEYGLTHWGSDTQGVNITRRFLCEALSFQHRYIPIGLLETMPPRMNDRPPAYKGRSELETLLASPFSGDWVKISEMFLGPADSGFHYQPKHKSNAYGTEEAQG